MYPDPFPPSATQYTPASSAEDVRRQRLAGWLLIAGGLVTSAALFLPWVTGTLPASYQCSDCQPVTVSPGWDIIGLVWRPISRPGQIGMPGGFLGLLVYLLILLGPPLAFAYLGQRLLRRSMVQWNLAAWGWGKTLAIVGSILYVLLVQVLLQFMGLHFMMTGRVLRFESGYFLATLMSIVLLIASFMIPTGLERV